jgi:hypothetical protein
MALKCADLGHASAPWEVHFRWVRQLEEEFFLQVFESLSSTKSFLTGRAHGDGWGVAGRGQAFESLSSYEISSKEILLHRNAHGHGWGVAGEVRTRAALLGHFPPANPEADYSHIEPRE